MQKLALYTKDNLLLSRWKSFLTNYEIKIIEDYEDLINLENSLLIVSSCVNLENEEFIISNILRKENKILFLERVPNLQKAKNWFALGIQGYGNSMMASVYLNSAIETILGGYIWLLPEITTQLIKNINIEKDKNVDKIFKDLTKTEEKIAILIKNGYTNTQISEELEISINTIKTHIKHIYEKLKVNDRLSFINLFF
ncbi:response regulator transcription factor [Aliarcobacter butzleri]|uniref:response regulator transcription factor n=1 Tax=Aliarcobacter butzleri TaxID=28197 RepID=UPI003AE1F279